MDGREGGSGSRIPSAPGWGCLRGSLGGGGLPSAGEGEAEGESDPDDTEATSELFVKPFPGEWADNEEVRRHAPPGP